MAKEGGAAAIGRKLLEAEKSVEEKIDAQEIGKLGPKQLKHVQEWLIRKIGKNKPCFMCGETKWAVATHIVHVPSEPALGRGGITLPVVPLMCLHCGNQALLNAVHMGVLEVGEDDV